MPETDVPAPADVTRVGPFLIERQLGRGGMGVVYAGRHETTGALAAIKTVTGADGRRMFQIRREIDALARLAHPGVVRILDHGADAGVPWYAMERLDGRTLEEVHRDFLEHPLHITDSDPDAATTIGVASVAPGRAGTDAAVTVPAPAPRRVEAAGGHLAEALGLTARLCETLAFVHGEGIIHRDLKPSNIFVNSRGLPILVDFGLVAHVGGVTGRDVLDGTWVAGSCLFMAPEQIYGELLDPRTDLYAVGCILYLLLTGRPPFTGINADVVRHHLHSTPAPPSSVVTGVPHEVDQLVLRLLAKQPRDRVGHAHDVAAVLQRLHGTAPPWAAELPRTRTYLYRPPLVGRQALLDQIEETTRRLIEGRGGLILLGGESGVGKTRIALEIASRIISRGQDVVTSVCVPGQPPLTPLRPLLQHIADACVAAGPAESERVFGERGPLLAMYEPSIAGLPGQSQHPPVTPLPQAAARERLFRALTETIALAIATRPTGFVVDDLQWADELTGAFLEHLGGAVAGMPLVILGTYRSEERTPVLDRLLALPGAAGLTVPRLPADVIGEMVSGMLSLPTPPPAFVTFLAGKTEGNPFFIAEYLRTAVSEQVLVRTRAGHWTFAESDDPTEVVCESLPLPRSLRDVIVRRLSTLTPGALAVLRAAAVIGREFDPHVLLEVAGVDDLELAGALTELVDRHVIENAELGGFRIAHDKLREIPYAELDDRTRRALHARAAAALEARGGDAQPGRLGQHWLEAGEPERAAPHLERAGDRALALHAPLDAIALYRAALAAVTGTRTAAPSGPQAAGVREKLGDALALTGNPREARDVFGAAIPLAPTPIDAARLYRKSGKTLETEHDHPKALEAYAQAERQLLDAVDRDTAWHREWVQVQLNRIWVFYWQNRTEDMNQVVDRVKPAVTEHGSALQRSNYYQALVTRDYRLRRYRVDADVINNARLSLAAAEEAHAPIETVFARFVLGFGLLFAGELVEAESQLTEAEQAARRTGDVTSALRSQVYLALTLRRQQRVDEAARVAAEANDAATALKMDEYVGLAEAVLGWVAWKRGDAAEARRVSQAAIDRWNARGFPYPFQWTAVLTLLAVQLTNVPLRSLVKLIEPLLAPGQLRLPDPVDGALAAAVAAHRDQDAELTREALQRAVAESIRAGFL